MKKVTGFFIICLGIVSIVNGQEFRILDDSVSTTGPEGNIIAPKTSIENTTNDTMVFWWVRGDSQIPSEWKNPGVCDVNLCYDNQDSAKFKLPPNESGILKVNFYAFDSDYNAVGGKGYINVIVYPKDKGRNAAQSTYFQGTTDSYSGMNLSASQNKLFKLYPNPAQNNLKFEFSTQGSHKIELFSIVGEKIKSRTFSNSKKASLSLHDLEQGIYVIRYQNANERIVTKTFTKE